MGARSLRKTRLQQAFLQQASRARSKAVARSAIRPARLSRDIRGQISAKRYDRYTPDQSHPDRIDAAAGNVRRKTKTKNDRDSRPGLSRPLVWQKVSGPPNNQLAPGAVVMYLETTTFQRNQRNETLSRIHRSQFVFRYHPRCLAGQ